MFNLYRKYTNYQILSYSFNNVSLIISLKHLFFSKWSNYFSNMHAKYYLVESYLFSPGSSKLCLLIKPLNFSLLYLHEIVFGKKRYNILPGKRYDIHVNQKKLSFLIIATHHGLQYYNCMAHCMLA